MRAKIHREMGIYRGLGVSKNQELLSGSVSLLKAPQKVQAGVRWVVSPMKAIHSPYIVLVSPYKPSVQVPTW